MGRNDSTASRTVFLEYIRYPQTFVARMSVWVRTFGMSEEKRRASSKGWIMLFIMFWCRRAPPWESMAKYPEAS